MPTTPEKDPRDRFSGLSDLYARFRPSYPDAALDFIVSRCGLVPGSTVIDVGCGTGISSRLMASRGLRVIGIEPNAEMRARAAVAALPPHVLAPEYRDGKAEATGLPSGFADAVLCAQAFHWFDPDMALQEFSRILKPDGWVALIWNERDENDAMTRAYGDVLRSLPETANVEGPRGQAGTALLRTPLFEMAERVVFSNSQEVDEEGLLGRAFSASYVPRKPDRARTFAADLRQVFSQYQRAGKVVLRYESSVYVARRRAETL